MSKSPTIVDETCDIAVTARRIMWAAFVNAGQTCLRPDYVLVSAKVGDELVAAIQRAITAFFEQDPQKSASYGRLITQKAFDRVAEFLEKDAEYVVSGGEKDREDLFVAPTLLNFKTDVDAFTRSAVMQEEVFSPLLPVVYYDTLDEAIDFVNDREKPLALYLYSSEYKTRMRVLANQFWKCMRERQHSADDKLQFVNRYAMLDAPQRYMPYNDAALKIVLMLIEAPSEFAHRARRLRLHPIV
ncbi:4,4'-diaponeurosporen-aldehyde dehydrogenase [Phytophthora ramorum]|uniref:4,4'-diaponeurosporen-aldehyde dehydrogenase n=1 Tax=Phytophthora ramorum TaxID=164328 RepID=UPI00309BFFDE|nr:4,4'-diaponeurosporen-aldehyde dehydrogenase [Phytophthora ramorum]